MNRFQMEHLYEANGLNDYRLKTPEDLLKTHGIDYQEVDGYSLLDDVNRQLYEEFVVSFFNGQGLESRLSLIPKGIYYVEDYDLIAKENPNDEYYRVTGGVVLAIDKNGGKTVHHTWNDPDFSHLESEQAKSKFYLRFEYEHHGRNEWQHVESGNSWY